MQQLLPSIGPIPTRQPQVPDTRSRHELAEDMAWAHLYRAVRDPPAAAEVVRYLDGNPEARSRHEALYLVARETLSVKALADARSERTAALLRAVFVTAPIRALRPAKSVFAGIAKVFASPAAEPPARPSRPEVSRARARIDVLRKHPATSPAISSLDASPPRPPTAADAPDSGTKAV